MPNGIPAHKIHTPCVEPQEECELENRTLSQLLRLGTEYRELYDKFISESQAQRELVDRLWVLSQRYVILNSTGTCCKYPQVYSAPAEETILKEFHNKLGTLRESNERLMQSLDPLRLSMRVFESLYQKIDFKKKTAFVAGDAHHKPLAYFIELCDDIFKYFHAHFLKMTYQTHGMEPREFTRLENYKTLLEINTDFEEYLLLGLSYCKCLKPPPVCPPT